MKNRVAGTTAYWGSPSASRMELRNWDDGTVLATINLSIDGNDVWVYRGLYFQGLRNAQTAAQADVLRHSTVRGAMK